MATDRDARPLVAPTSRQAWWRLFGFATSIAVGLLVVAQSRWPLSLWWYWLAPSGVVAATAFLLARRRYLLEVHREREWTLTDKIIIVVHQLCGLTTLMTLLLKR